MKFPAFIGIKVFIEANTVDNEILLLLSRASMKRAKLVLDFSRDMAVVFDESIKLMCTSTGHYCIQLTYMFLTNNNPKIWFVLHTFALKSLLVGFYGILTFEGYLIPNQFLYKWTVLFQTIQFSISTV